MPCRDIEVMMCWYWISFFYIVSNFSVRRVGKGRIVGVVKSKKGWQCWISSFWPGSTIFEFASHEMGCLTTHLCKERWGVGVKGNGVGCVGKGYNCASSSLTNLRIFPRVIRYQIEKQVSLGVEFWSFSDFSMVWFNLKWIWFDPIVFADHLSCKWWRDCIFWSDWRHEL